MLGANIAKPSFAEFLHAISFSDYLFTLCLIYLFVYLYFSVWPINSIELGPLFYPVFNLCLLTVCCAQSLSPFWLFETLWTVTCQVTVSIGYFRQEYWNWLPFPFSGDLPNSGINWPLLSLLQCRQILSPLIHQWSPIY